jgi:xanthosine phosphorylase
MNDLHYAALAAFRHAHAPYSGFRVGVALRAASGAIFVGANVENASFPEGNCAEASAIAAMVAAGERVIAEVCLVAEGERLCTPCGGCRQRLTEFAGPELPVHLCDPAGLRRTVTLGELLPFGFELRAELADSRAPEPPAATDATAYAWAEAVAAVRRATDLVPRVGVILGSGLGRFADSIEDPIALPYAELPGFPATTVAGHGGRLVLGRVAGVPLACLQGRVHLYEGLPMSAVNGPIRALKALGCSALVVTNAAGSLRADLGPGALVVIEDHINLLGSNPLIGPNDDALGPRFLELSQAYDRAWRQMLEAAAARCRIPLRAGVYMATLGPVFETPAEIRAFRALGADLVGMSTVPEVISARHAGMKVLGLSVVTNLAAGLAAEPHSHFQTLAVAEAAAASVERLLRGLFEELGRDGWTAE